MMKGYIISTKLLLLGAVGLLSAAGALVSHPEDADIQGVISKVAYFAFVFVLVTLMGVGTWLYFGHHTRRIRDGQMIVCILHSHCFTFFQGCGLTVDYCSMSSGS